MGLLQSGRSSSAASALAALQSSVPRLGGSDAQRELVEEVRIAALLRDGRYDEATALLDDRLDRRPSARDRAWRRYSGDERRRMSFSTPLVGLTA